MCSITSWIASTGSDVELESQRREEKDLSQYFLTQLCQGDSLQCKNSQVLCLIIVSILCIYVCMYMYIMYVYVYNVCICGSSNTQ